MGFYKKMIHLNRERKGFYTELSRLNVLINGLFCGIKRKDKSAKNRFI